MVKKLLYFNYFVMKACAIIEGHSFTMTAVLFRTPLHQLSQHFLESVVGEMVGLKWRLSGIDVSL